MKDIIIPEGYKICPTCKGAGYFIAPPYLAGEVKHFTNSTTHHECGTCKGKKIINIATGLPPSE